MSSVNEKDLKLLMSEDMKEIKDKMVFEGVTPKSYMRKVKAMKKLWRSDSFQMLKAILKEPPIKEGRVRPPVIELKGEEDEDDIDTDASPGYSTADRNKILKETDFLKKKEDLIKVYRDAICEDVEHIKIQTEEIIKETLERARKQVETVEEGYLEDAIKEKVKEMIQNIKKFKVDKEISLKLLVEEDRKTLTADLLDYLKREADHRIMTYRQLLGKTYDFRLRTLTLITDDEYEDKARQILWSYFNNFNRAKKTLIVKQKHQLEELECRLQAEYTEALQWSSNRVDAAVEEAIKDIEVKSESIEQQDDDTESTCSIVLRLEDKIRKKGWLKWFPHTEEEWERLVEEMLHKFHIFINIIMGGKQWNESECLISLEKLKSFKDRIAKITEKRLMEIKDTRTVRKKRLKAMTEAASLINYLIREVLPSPIPSRVSFSELESNKYVRCSHSRKRNDSYRSTLGDLQSLAQVKTSQRVYDSRKASMLSQNVKRKSYAEAVSKINTPSTIKTYVEIARETPALFNLIFSNI